MNTLNQLIIIFKERPIKLMLTVKINQNETSLFHRVYFLGDSDYRQVDNLPPKVNDAFIEKYPNAQNISWFEDNDIVSIDFEQAKDYFKALYSKDGQWIETRRRIENESFPSKIVKIITIKYPSIQLINGDFVETKKGEKFYRFFGYTTENDYTINVSMDGNILSPIN